MGRVYQRKGRAGWYVDYVDADGNRIRDLVTKLPGRKGERIAQNKLVKLEERRDRIKAGMPVPDEPTRVDLQVIWKAFRAHLVANGRRPRTIRDYEQKLPGLLVSIGAQHAGDIAIDRLNTYKAERRAAGISNRTINAAISSLHTMLRWAVRHEHLRDDPLRHIEMLPSHPVHERRPLEDEEIEALLRTSPAHYRRIWVAFLATGLRHNELVELCWKDIDRERGLLRVRAETCKVRREDFLPIAPELEEVLREVEPEGVDPEQHVFLNAAGRPWRNNLLKRFKTCVKSAEINPVGLDIHSLRQTYGTLLAADPENDIKTVQSLMRHKTIAMTMNLYVKPRAQRRRAALGSLKLAQRGTRKAPAENGERNHRG